jgi:hypothetical protein
LVNPSDGVSKFTLRETSSQLQSATWPVFFFGAAVECANGAAADSPWPPAEYDWRYRASRESVSTALKTPSTRL